MSTAIHDFAPEEIMAHHDGELPADRAQQISAHLESCAECRHLVESFHLTSQSLAAWTSLPVSSSFESSVLPVPLSSKQRDISEPRSLWRDPLRRRAIIGVSLVACAGVALFLKSSNYSYSVSHARQELAVEQRMEGRQSSVAPAASPMATGASQSSQSRTVRGLTTLNAPGIAADSNGLFHGLGDHVSNSFSIDAQATTPAPMIARTADLQILATNLDSARAGLENVLIRNHGYAANLNVSNAQSTARTLNASLRIPSPELTAALVQLKSLGHVINESQAGEEVTAEHADLVARLKNSRETEIRLQDILRTRTGKVSDVLEVEQEIARVRGEIEQMESELKGLDHRVDFATVNLTITEEYKAKVSDTTPGVATRFHNAAVAGLTNVTDSAVGLILWLAEFLPPMIFWLLILVAPAAVFWRLRRRAIAGATASPLV
jgi:hypothetical protein